MFYVFKTLEPPSVREDKIKREIENKVLTFNVK